MLDAVKRLPALNGCVDVGSSDSLGRTEWGRRLRLSSILYISTVSGTLRRFISPLARHFRNQGWRVDGMSCGISRNAECLQAFDYVWDVPFSRKPLAPSNFVSAPGIVRNVVVHQRYDIVHVHTPVAAFVTRWALHTLPKARRPAVVYTAHGFHFHSGGMVLGNIVFKVLERWAGRWTDCLVVINEEDRRAAERLAIVPSTRLFYMPGIGVDTDEFSPDAVSENEIRLVRSEMGLSDGDVLFSIIGALTPNKRPCDAIRALALVRCLAVHLAFAGQGPLLTQARHLAMQLGVDRRVHFLGYRRDIPAIIRASHATMLPSRREGLPRSIMESLSMGVPVIGANTRGTRDLLSEGAGLLVQVGDVRGYAEAMDWIADHPLEAASMGSVGRVQMAGRSIHTIASLHEDVYRSVMS